MCGPAAAAETAQEHARAPEHPERICLSVQQARATRDHADKLAEPFRVTTFVAHHFQAETLRVKLCRRKDEFIYEISLLQRDGRVIDVSTSMPSLARSSKRSMRKTRRPRSRIRTPAGASGSK